MNKLFKLAELFKIKLATVEHKPSSAAAERALADHEGQSVYLKHNGQHHGWFIWNEKIDKHEQIDLNDFEDGDEVKTVRNLVHGLDVEVDLKDYEVPATDPNTEFEDQETYGGSAYGTRITVNRATHEAKKHGRGHPEDEEFKSFLSTHTGADKQLWATDLLAWLGY